MRFLLIASLAACGEPGWGEISILNRNAVDEARTEVSGAFFLGEPPQNCDSQISPDCWELCSRENPDAAQSAGTMTITGGMEPITVRPSNVHGHYQWYLETLLFEGGETAHIRTSGDEGPGFSRQIVTASQITIVQPAKPADGMPLVIDSSQDFQIAWTGGGASEEVVFRLSGILSTEQTVAIRCSAPATAGMITLPAGAIPSTPPWHYRSFSVGSRISEQATVDGWDLTIDTLFNGGWPDNTAADGTFSTL